MCWVAAAALAKAIASPEHDILIDGRMGVGDPSPAELARIDHITCLPSKMDKVGYA